MDCRYHTNIEATAKCDNCGKAICDSCKCINGESIVCSNCLQDLKCKITEHLIQRRKKTIIKLILLIFITIGYVLISKQTPLFDKTIIIFICIGIVLLSLPISILYAFGLPLFSNGARYTISENEINTKLSITSNLSKILRFMLGMVSCFFLSIVLLITTINTLVKINTELLRLENKQNI